MQAILPRLQDLVSDNDSINVVEIFSTPRYFKEVSEMSRIDLKWEKTAEFFSLENPQQEIQYHHRDMRYIFDIKNDAQKGVRRILKKEMFYKNLYITSLQEEIVPSHCFPCTKDVSAIIQVTRYVQKINNRMSWIYEKEENGCWICYIRYQHSPNVEMTKMQNDLERTLERMPRPIKM